MGRDHSPYTVLVVEYDRFHYINVKTKEDTLATVDSELSKDTTSCCIGYYSRKYIGDLL